MFKTSVAREDRLTAIFKTRRELTASARFYGFSSFFELPCLFPDSSASMFNRSWLHLVSKSFEEETAGFKVLIQPMLLVRPQYVLPCEQPTKWKDWSKHGEREGESGTENGTWSDRDDNNFNDNNRETDKGRRQWQREREKERERERDWENSKGRGAIEQERGGTEREYRGDGKLAEWEQERGTHGKIWGNKSQKRC